MDALIEQNWERVEGWLEALLELPADERRAWLAARCEDEALARAVLSLLEAETEGGRMLGGLRADLGLRPQPGSFIGPYRILRLLGEGGMAAVFLAERETAEFAQQVALKLMRIGMFDAERIGQFRREQQIHATLVHPHIARVFDSGISSAGLPYFVIEHVDGQAIDRHCDQRRLTIEQRLALFLKVCDAVAYAQQNLVVHRDLKPSNILVGDDGEPKLLDFGIAKLLADEFDERTRTLTVQRQLTPAYAAPEQFRGEAITTATDVYALGVLLAELLSGRRPPPADGDVTAPLRPVTSLAAAGEDGEARAALRGLDRAGLLRRLRGDLDWIVARALAPEPARRYPSAAALADDLRRHRDGLPILAGPASFTYRGRKFAARHAGALAATFAIVLTLVAATVVSRDQAARAQREAARAEAEAARAAAEAERAQASKRFLLQLFVATAPGAQAPPQSADEVLARGRAEAERAFAGQPEVQVELLGAIGDVERMRGHHVLAQETLSKAVRLAREHFAPGDARTLALAVQLAEIDHVEGRFREGEEALAAELARHRARAAPASAVLSAALAQIGVLRMRQGRLEDAEPLLVEAVAMARSVDQGSGSELFSALLALSECRVMRGAIADALPLQEEALRLSEGSHGADHPRVSEVLLQLAMSQRALARLDLAEVSVRRALTIVRRVHTEPSAHLTTTINDLAVNLAAVEQLDEARALFAETLALQRTLYAPAHPYLANTEANLAAVDARLGRLDAALATLQGALERLRAARGPEHAMVTRHELELARLLARSGDFAAAGRALEHAEAAELARNGESHPGTAFARLVRAELAAAQGEHAEAVRAADAVLAYYATIAPSHPRAIEAELIRAQARSRLGQATRAELEEALARAQAATPPLPRLVASAQLLLGEQAWRAGDGAAATRWLQAAEAGVAAAPHAAAALAGRRSALRAAITPH